MNTHKNESDGSLSVKKGPEASGEKMQHILVALCGTSPAVVSETVYELIRRKDTPDRIIIVTTRLGKEYAKSLQDAGIWDKLREIAKKKIELEFRVFQDENGNELEDIVSETDNKRFADFLLDILRCYTEKHSTKVSMSIAGGRKTMSAIGALCMTMLGRAQDRLYHILVNPPFDQLMTPPFYFPEKGVKHKLSGKDGKTTMVKSETAKLSLSELPFVRTRNHWEKDFKHLPADYSDAVETINTPIKIRIDLTATDLSINGKKFFVRDSASDNGAQTLLVLYILYYCKKYGGFSEFDLDELAETYKEFFRIFKPHPKFKLRGKEDIETGRISRLFSELNKKAAKEGISISFSVKHGKYGIPDTIPLENIITVPNLKEESFSTIAAAINLKQITHHNLD